MTMLPFHLHCHAAAFRLRKSPCATASPWPCLPKPYPHQAPRSYLLKAVTCPAMPARKVQDCQASAHACSVHCRTLSCRWHLMTPSVLNCILYGHSRKRASGLDTLPLPLPCRSHPHTLLTASTKTGACWRPSISTSSSACARDVGCVFV